MSFSVNLIINKIQNRIKCTIYVLLAVPYIKSRAVCLKVCTKVMDCIILAAKTMYLLWYNVIIILSTTQFYMYRHTVSAQRWYL